MRKRTTTTARRKAAPRKRTTTARRKPTTRRRSTTRKKGLGDLFTRNEAQSAVEQLVGIAAGYIVAENAGRFLNPNGDKDKLEIFGKLAAGFLVSTTARMPNLGAGIMAAGVKKIFEVNQGLADAAGVNRMPGKQTQYLAAAPKMEKTNFVLSEDGTIYLNDYAAAYQSRNY
jgi:hypothetical protein